MTSKVLPELYYTESHEWIRIEGKKCVVGITEHAQLQLGELVFVQLPEAGDKVHAGDEIAVIESVKTAADVFSPLSGEIIAINEDLDESPSLVNSDPFHDGWLFELEFSDDGEFEELWSAERYTKFLAKIED